MTDESRAAMTEEMVSVELKLPPIVAELLAVLDRDVAHVQRRRPEPGSPGFDIPGFTQAAVATTLEQRCARVLLQLADHAQQGVRQNGAWERQWVTQAFGDGWLERTEPGDAYNRANDQSDEELNQRMYRRPKRG